jgi:AcrR family transcriptional regulator
MQPQSPVQKRTVQHIVHVTYQLLYTNYFDVITVQQICEEAEINRSTFYRYFEDKYDLLYYLAQYIGYTLKSKVHSQLMFDESFEKSDELAMKIRESDYPEMLCDFMSAGLIEVLKNWVDNNYDDDAKELYHFFKNTIGPL